MAKKKKDEKKGKRKSFKKKEKRTLLSGIVHIQATFNNTHVTISDMEGNVVAWASAGGQGFKGSRKGTPFAAQQAASQAAQAVRAMGCKTVDVRVKGPGSGRESAPAALQGVGLSCVLAPSYARVFLRNCINMGFAAIVIDSTAGIAEGDELEVDLEAPLNQRPRRG